VELKDYLLGGAFNYNCLLYLNLVELKVFSQGYINIYILVISEPSGIESEYEIWIENKEDFALYLNLVELKVILSFQA